MIGKSYFFLILFVAFLATPFIVSALQQDDDDSYAMTLSEEEKSTDGNYEFEKDLKIKDEFAVHYFYESDTFFQPVFYSGLLLSKIYLDPAFPPPKTI